MPPSRKKIILIIGGVRSGKSSFAQQLAQKHGGYVLFVATGEPLDAEMRARIVQHKKDRPATWRTVEASHHISKAIVEQCQNTNIVIVDCLTLLVSNLLVNEPEYEDAERKIMTEINDLIKSMRKLKRVFIIVSNEVGLGIVPDNKLARIYRDLLGKANQLIASEADEVYFMCAGIPLKIKMI